MKTHCEECGSSDGKHVYEDGHTHCFVCNNTVQLRGQTVSTDDLVETFEEVTNINSIQTYRSYPIESRGISHEVVDFFETKMALNKDGSAGSHFYPATRKGKIVAYKERIIDTKEFRWHGKKAGIELYGQSKFSPGKKLVVCEGEIDTKSVAEAFRQYRNIIYPVVGLFSSTGTDDFLFNRDWINGFDEVIIMMDMDEAGEKAANICAKMVKAGKAKIARLPENDANDTLLKHGHMKLMRAIWDAQTWSPSGIVVGEAIWDQYTQRKLVETLPYPDCLSGINEKIRGMRYGEIALFVSGTGSGKSTAIKEIIFNVLNVTNEKVGLISLEEGIGDTAEKFISMEIKKPTDTGAQTTNEEERRGYERVFSDERLILLDHQGSVDDENLIDKIEYMALMGCKYLILDHITIAVSEGAEGLSGNAAIDKMMSDLLKLVKKHNLWLGLVSHLRKSQNGSKNARSFEEGRHGSLDDIKGSGSIKQISFDVISLARNQTAETEEERNRTFLRVLKSRTVGRTGDCGTTIYNPDTGRLHNGGDVSLIDFEDL